MSNLQFNNSSGQCVLQERSQFGASNATGFLASNDSPISKLATDDYMTELGSDHLISLNLSNNGRHLSAVQQLSAIPMDQQQPPSTDASNTPHSNSHSVHNDPASDSRVRQISNQFSNPIGNPISNQIGNSISNSINNQTSHQISNEIGNPISNQISNQITDQNTNQNTSQNINQNINQNTNKTNSPPTSQPNSQTSQHNDNQRAKHNTSPPPPAADSDDELFEEADSSDESSGANQAAAMKPGKGECRSAPVDIETMRTHLVKLKLSKDLSGSPNSNVDSPLTNEPNEENEYTFFDAIDDYDDEEIERGPMIRSTSLKTGKAKSLGPKKTLRFADALGLDLAKVKNISQEDLPNVPASAFRDLKMCKREVKEEFFNNQLSCSPVRSSYLGNRPPVAGSSPFGVFGSANQFNRAPLLSNGILSAGSDLITPAGNWPILVPEFVQPFTQYNFLERVRSQKVCLESCIVSSIGNNLSIDCIIRVLNISFEKTIKVRHTTNNWGTWLDALASYIPNSSDGQTDKFSVKFYIKSLTKGQRVKFAIIYQVNAEEHWDNNWGGDYCLLYKT